MPGIPYQYFSTFANKRISKSITPQNYARSALLWLLMGVTTSQGSDGLGIGRPNEGLFLTGANVSPAKKESYRSVETDLVRFQGSKLHNTAVTGSFGTMPSVASPTTSSQDLALMNAAGFRWCQNIDTPIFMWNTTLEMAQNKASEDNGVAVGMLTEEAIDSGMQEHYDQINSRIIYGAPSNQDAIAWDDISGVISSLTTTNRYGMVDRTVLSSGHPWMPLYAATFTPDVTKLTDYVNTTLGTAVFGPGTNVILVGGTNYLIFKNQAIARDRGCYMEAGTSGEKAGLPGYAKTGITREFVRVNNTIVMHEPFLDVCYGLGTSGSALYTAQPGYGLCLNLAQYRFITHPNRSMKAENLVDLHDKSVGAPDGRQAFIRTWAMLECLRPQTNVLIGAFA